MKKVIIIILTIIIIVFGLYFIQSGTAGRSISKSDDYDEAAKGVGDMLRERTRGEPMDIRLEGHSIKGLNYRVLVDANLKPFASEDFLEDILGCAVRRYSGGDLVIERGDAKVSLTVDDVWVLQDVIFIPLDDRMKTLDYNVEMSFAQNYIDFSQINGNPALPAAYDMRKDDRVTPVRDQGKYGTCWAFASLGALETVTMPYEENIYSPDHMTLSNSYKLDVAAGGDHSMSIAYMAAWQGPVYEEDDPYGDRKTDEKLTAAKHLEEAVVINERDDEVIKSAIYRYGGIETSLYLAMSYDNLDSKYYNNENDAYYSPEPHKPNHDVVIVGWDDNYSRDNFGEKPKKDGAFICRNSWGRSFGEGGYFYVSYEDPNICTQSVVYTRLAEKDNFDRIYQSDMLGWVGQMGFESDTSYFANVYTAEGDERLAGVSFYSTDKNTEFSVYLVHDFKDTNDFEKKELVASGGTRYAGYYTVHLSDEELWLKPGERFAVLVYIKTPGSQKPVAVEYAANDRSSKADITDGEGYISQYGSKWTRTEEELQANVCLKAFTVKR